jgi:hypothetical protein
MLSRTTIATILAVAAVAALAITSLAQSERTQSSVSVQPALVQTLPASAPRDAGAVGRFAFGHVEADQDPSAPGGVPGFRIWPPGSLR